MKIPFIKGKQKKEDIDYLSLTLKEKLIQILKFCLKWGGIIVLIEVLLWIILEFAIGGFFFEPSVLIGMGGFYFPTNFLAVSFYKWFFWDTVATRGYFISANLVPFDGGSIYETALLYLPAAALIIGGCMGGLSRYNVPPKLRIIEPEDQAVTPIDFQIRVRYDEKRVDPQTISIAINEKVIPSKISEEGNFVHVSSIFKTPPKKATSLFIRTIAIDEREKEIMDKIRIICDPESDAEDYYDYWEFKREDETFWGKEMVAANKHAKRNLNAMKLIVFAVFLVFCNYLLSLIIRAIAIKL